MATPSKELQTQSIHDSGLATTQEFSNELSPTSAAAEKRYEIEGAIIVAKRFPRDENTAFEKLMRSCKRGSFAEDAEYSFPRGMRKDPKTDQWVENLVTGVSVNLVREAKRVWGNIRSGFEVLRDSDESRKIRAWAWDVETNTYEFAEDEFKKLVFRKAKKDKKGQVIKAEGWYPPDERDLRELTNRRAAILERNCISQLLPRDLLEEAIKICRETLQSDANSDPDAAKKKIILAFSELNVSPQMLEEYLKHPLDQSSPAEIVNLRGIYKSIFDGNSTWAEYVVVPENGNSGEATNGATKSERIAEQLKQQANAGQSTQTSAENALNVCHVCGVSDIETKLFKDGDKDICGECAAKKPDNDSSKTTQATAQTETAEQTTTQSTLTLPELPNATLPENVRATTLENRMSMDQYEMLKEWAGKAGVPNLNAEVKQYLGVDVDDLNKEAAFFFIEFLKFRCEQKK